MADVLTIADAVALDVVLKAAQGNKRVARLMPDTQTIVEGTARRLGDDHGCNVTGADVRDLKLWVTTSGGWEVFWPVRTLMAQVTIGEFAITD